MITENLDHYLTLKNKIRDEGNAFPYGFAFSDEQFDRMMEKWGLGPTDTDKIVQLGMGAFVRKADIKAMQEMWRRHDKMIADAVAEDKTGEGFVYEAFLYELQNHEYLFNYDKEQILNTINLSLKDLEENNIIADAFKRAERAYFKMCDDNDWW